jgi:hypothetical protein
MKVAPPPLTLRLLSIYQALLCIPILWVSGLLAFLANLLLQIIPINPNAYGYPNYHNNMYYSPVLGMMLFVVAILVALISLGGFIAAINLSLRKRWAWVVSVAWHGVMILPLIIIIQITFPFDNSLPKILAGIGFATSFFSLFYLNKTPIRRYFFIAQQSTGQKK